MDAKTGIGSGSSTRASASASASERASASVSVSASERASASALVNSMHNSKAESTAPLASSDSASLPAIAIGGMLLAVTVVGVLQGQLYKSQQQQQISEGKQYQLSGEAEAMMDDFIASAPASLSFDEGWFTAKKSEVDDAV